MSRAVYDDGAHVINDEPTERPSRKRNWKRHSTGMMAGGIVMVSLAPIAFIVSMVGSYQQSNCKHRGVYDLTTSTRTYGDVDCSGYDAAIYGGVLTGVALLGVGIPLIVIGAKRKPLGAASVSPWATPEAAGLRLRLVL